MNTLLKSVRDNFTNILTKIPRIPFREDSLFATLYLLFLVLPFVFVLGMGEAFETPKSTVFYFLTGAVIILLFAKDKLWYKLPKSLLISSSVFIITIVLSTIFSQDIRNSFVGLVGRPSNSALFLLCWLLIGYALFVSFTEQKLLAMLKLVVWTGLPIAVYSILQHGGIGFYAGATPDARQFIPSFLGNPNFNSMYLAMVIPIAIYFVSVTKTFHSKVFYLTNIVLMIWATAQTASRAAILALLIALVIQTAFYIYNKTSRAMLLVSIGGIVVTLLLSYLALNVYRPDNISKSLQFEDTTQQHRLIVWVMTLEMIKDKPLLGTGLSNYFMDFAQYGWPTFSFGERFDDPHNVALLLAVNGGVFMLLSFAGLLLSILYLARRQILNNPLATTLAVSVLAWLIAGSFGPIVLACWLLLALVLAGLLLMSFQKQGFRLQSKLWQPLATLAGVIVIIFGIIIITSNVFSEVAESYYGKQQYQQSLQWARIALLDEIANTDANDYIVRSMVELNYPPAEVEQVLLQSLQRRSHMSSMYVEAATIYYKLWHQTKDQSYLEKMNANMDKAVELEPNFAGLYAKFAYLSFMAGDIDRALTFQKLSLTSYHDEFYGWVLLSKLYYEQNMRDQFLYAYEKAYKNSGEFLIKGTLEGYQQTADIKSIPFPVFFPEPQ